MAVVNDAQSGHSALFIKHHYDEWWCGVEHFLTVKVKIQISEYKRLIFNLNMHTL